MNENLIYGLRCPKTDNYRYIGKSTSGLHRAKAHLTYSHNQSVNYWVNDLREEGLCPLVDVIEICTEEDLQIKEKFWIQFYNQKGCNLLNSIVYRGAAIEKLEEDAKIYKAELEKTIKGIAGEIKDLSTTHGFIKSRRKTLGVTQKSLAQMAKISVRNLIEIESGKGNHSFSTIEKLLDILGYKLVPTLKNFHDIQYP